MIKFDQVFIAVGRTVAACCTVHLFSWGKHVYKNTKCKKPIVGRAWVWLSANCSDCG